MLAHRLLQAQTKPEFQGVPEPHAGPGQVVVRVAGSGLCHTDRLGRSGGDQSDQIQAHDSEGPISRRIHGIQTFNVLKG